MTETPQEPQPQDQAQQAPQLPPIEQLVAALEGFINVTLMGICVCNQHIPPHVIWLALVRAAGRCFSRATKAAQVAQTLELRNQFAKAFEDELRRFVPAVDKVLDMPLAANANGRLPPLQ